MRSAEFLWALDAEVSLALCYWREMHAALPAAGVRCVRRCGVALPQVEWQIGGRAVETGIHSHC